ncbi:MAG: hypothetical protein ACYCRF_11230 [Acidithiobacillus sp.]
MSSFVFANFLRTTLSAAVSSGSTTLSLASSANLPTLTAGQQLPVLLQDAATGNIHEVCYATAINSTTLTVLRAQEGTGALTWSVGDYVYTTVTAGSFASLPQLGTDNTWNGINYFEPDVLIDSGSQDAIIVSDGSGRVLADGLSITVKALFTNGGGVTIDYNATGAVPVWGRANNGLQSGEFTAGIPQTVTYSASKNAWLISGEGIGPLQVGQAFQSQHAVQLSQSTAGAAIVSTSNVLGTLYTNNSSRMRFVFAIVSVAGALTQTANIDGHQVFGASNPTNSPDDITVILAVPPGSTYEIASGFGSLISWYEVG